MVATRSDAQEDNVEVAWWRCSFPPGALECRLSVALAVVVASRGAVLAYNAEGVVEVQALPTAVNCKLCPAPAVVVATTRIMCRWWDAGAFYRLVL